MNTKSPTDPGAIDLDAIKAYRGVDQVFFAAAISDLTAAVEALRERVKGFESDKHAPVQGYSAGIPWLMHLRAYDMYCKKYSPQPALVDLEKKNCRGGFGTEELDEFIPGWRDELSKTVQLLRRAEAAEARVVELESTTKDWIEAGILRGKRADQAETRVAELELAASVKNARHGKALGDRAEAAEARVVELAGALEPFANEDAWAGWNDRKGAYLTADFKGLGKPWVWAQDALSTTPAKALGGAKAVSAKD